MKTLYVSDLDGTLLRSEGKISKETVRVLNSLVEKGMLFTYATARSYSTAHKVTEGVDMRIPLITHNGAFMVDNATGEILRSNYFEENIGSLLNELIGHGIYPMVFSHINGEEKLSFIPEKSTEGLHAFINMRQGDKRLHPVEEEDALYNGEIFYILCVDEEAVLKPLYEKYKDKYHCVFQKEFYTGEQWLEIMPLAATKANAIRQLKELLQCEKLVVFGDGKNDLDMFEIADECYAVNNAVEELKAAATAVIGSNDADGVAAWLLENVVL